MWRITRHIAEKLAGKTIFRKALNSVKPDYSGVLCELKHGIKLNVSNARHIGKTQYDIYGGVPDNSDIIQLFREKGLEPPSINVLGEKQDLRSLAGAAV